MTLAEFDQRLERIDRERMAMEARLRELESLEAQLYHAAGVEFVRREPGFACWKINGVPGYFDTPRQALEAKERQ